MNNAKRILLVDDDSVLTGVIAKYLTAAGYSLSVAPSATRALLMAVEEAPDVIICDWHLPEMPGSDILQLFRQQQATAKVPVIIITADRTANAPDAFDVLQKPFHPQVLIDAVNRALDQGKAGG